MSEFEELNPRFKESLNRPEIRNALTLVVLLELYRAVDNIENDDTVNAMIIL